MVSFVPVADNHAHPGPQPSQATPPSFRPQTTVRQQEHSLRQNVRPDPIPTRAPDLPPSPFPVPSNPTSNSWVGSIPPKPIPKHTSPPLEARNTDHTPPLCQPFERHFSSSYQPKYINLDARQLPSGWISYYDEREKAWVYVNTGAVPPIRTRSHPLGPLPPRATPPPRHRSSPASESRPFWTGPGRRSAAPRQRPFEEDPGLAIFGMLGGLIGAATAGVALGAMGSDEMLPNFFEDLFGDDLGDSLDLD